MELRPLGTSGMLISPVVMGTWQTGKSMWVGISDRESEKALRAAVDAGINAFDTAEYYGKGHSERLLGKTLETVRHQVIYATKVFPNHLRHNQVIEVCHRSLKNLRTDYIDLYQIHWPAGTFDTEKIPISETMGALNLLQEQGKIRAVGVSNFSKQQLTEAAAYGRIDSLQPPYSLFWRQVEADALPYCTQHQITLLAYSPLAQGLLTGKFGPRHRFEEGDHRANNRLFKVPHYDRVQKALQRLRPIAEAEGMTPAQLAIAWLISRPGICAIVGARNEDQVRENARAGLKTLAAERWLEIDRIGRKVTDHLDSNPVLWDF